MVCVSSLMYAPLGATLKLVVALCQQSGQQDVCMIRLCPAVSAMQLQPHSEVASQLSSAELLVLRERAYISRRSPHFILPSICSVFFADS